MDITNGQYRNQNDYIFRSQRWRSSIQSAKTKLRSDFGSDHDLLIAKFKLKLKKVGKTTRPFRYDLNQIPYDYTVEVTNRFKELDLVDSVPEKLWTEVHDIVQEAVIKINPQKGNVKRQIWPWNAEWSRAKTNRVLPRKCTGNSKHPLPTTQEKTLYMNITDGRQQNQIDFIICSQRWRSSIKSAKTRLGADCGSDYELLIAKFRPKLKKVRQTTRLLSSLQFSSVAQLCPTLCDPKNCSMPALPVHHHLWVHSDSRPSSPWCHPAISSSVVPFSSCPQSLPASKSFPMSQLFAWGGQSTGVSVSTSFLPKKSQGWSPSEWSGWISLQSNGLSRVFSRPQFKSINSSALSFLYSSTLKSIHDYWKIIALTRWTLLVK